MGAILAIVAGIVVAAIGGWLWMLEIQHERLRRRLNMAAILPTPKPTPKPTDPPPSEPTPPDEPKEPA